jgi:hypothetical protein
MRQVVEFANRDFRRELRFTCRKEIFSATTHFANEAAGAGFSVSRARYRQR